MARTPTKEETEFAVEAARVALREALEKMGLAVHAVGISACIITDHGDGQGTFSYDTMHEGCPGCFSSNARDWPHAVASALMKMSLSPETCGDGSTASEKRRH